MIDIPEDLFKGVFMQFTATTRLRLTECNLQVVTEGDFCVFMWDGGQLAWSMPDQSSMWQRTCLRVYLCNLLMLQVFRLTRCNLQVITKGNSCVFRWESVGWGSACMEHARWSLRFQRTSSRVYLCNLLPIQKFDQAWASAVHRLPVWYSW